MSLPLSSSILDQLSTAVMVCSANLEVLYVNPSCEALFELSQSRALGMPLFHLLQEASEGSSNWFDLPKALSRVIDSGHPFTRREALIRVGLQDKAVDYSVSLIEPQEKKKWLLIEFQPIERLLRISRDEAQAQQYQTTRQLVRGVAHEVKNPLGGIRGATQLLARSLPAPDLREFTQIILEEVDRLTLMVDTLLGSRQPPAFVPTNIHEVLERVLPLLNSVQNTPEALALNQPVQLIRDYDLSLPELSADPNLLIQVVLNISMNALQALTEQAPTSARLPRQITFRTRIQRAFTIHGICHRSVIRLDIEDNGPGIPPALLESVFYPMVTGRAKGTGLGLSIAQDIMQLHKGLIECQSVAGRTVFSLFLPWE